MKYTYFVSYLINDKGKTQAGNTVLEMNNAVDSAEGILALSRGIAEYKEVAHRSLCVINFQLLGVK